ncbi:EamA family transporter [Paenibacillus chitinolyticus]|uniref:EamA family transporter n=1 Tax=Paenibacillus chitinolyticus TaxID=79263 RepID=UPI002108942A|nr:EamA family transporter [Paenibacillus chitinolyticus]
MSPQSSVWTGKEHEYETACGHKSYSGGKHPNFWALQPSGITLRSYAALGYLIAFGSIVSYTAYIWLLKRAEPVLVSTYAFVNPVVAVFLGWSLAGEQLSPIR